MNGKTIQIKTVEKLIIQELYNSESSDHRVHTAFARVLDHFSDEDYLHKIGHQRLFAKYYLNLVGEPEDTLLLLHAELLKRTANSKKELSESKR